MSRIITHLLIVPLVFLAASDLRADDDTVVVESAPAQKPSETHPVWVGVKLVVPNQEENEYLIGTIDKQTLNAIELDQYKRRFVRLSNLRIEVEVETDGEEPELIHHDCADDYDWGIVLVRYKDIVSIELKKRDPLSLNAPSVEQARRQQREEHAVTRVTYGQ